VDTDFISQSPNWRAACARIDEQAKFSLNTMGYDRIFVWSTYLPRVGYARKIWSIRYKPGQIVSRRMEDYFVDLYPGQQ